ncbi:MAG: hypothetical protein AAFX99_13330 [Myxococcota bacterium]
MERHWSGLCCCAVVVAGTAVWVSSMHRPSKAACAAPEPELLWQYPADGQTDVPLNAAVWLHAEGFGEEVRLDGATLERSSDGTHRMMPELEPNTTYALEVEIARGDGSSVLFASTFRTGLERWSEALEAPELESVVLYEETFPVPELLGEELASRLAFKNSCFDTGIPNTVVMEIASNGLMHRVVQTIPTSGGEPFQIQSIPWPVEAGPLVLTDYSVTDGVCVEVMAYDVTGAQRSATVCPNDDRDEQTPPMPMGDNPGSMAGDDPAAVTSTGSQRSRGCTVMAMAQKTPNQALWALLLGGIFAWVEARRR